MALSFLTGCIVLEVLYRARKNIKVVQGPKFDAAAGEPDYYNYLLRFFDVCTLQFI